jgi:hypothetical protein
LHIHRGLADTEQKKQLREARLPTALKSDVSQNDLLICDIYSNMQQTAPA